MAKTLATLFGAIYLIVGIAGFIPAFGGTMSMTPSMLFGIADVNLLHNIVHVIIGLAGLAGGRSESGGISFCKTFGVILLLIGIVGYFQPNPLNILPIGGGDVWIHVVTGAILAIVGFTAASPSRANA
jgi:uncharacterized protein DUF4383